MRKVYLSAGHTSIKGFDRGCHSFHSQPSDWVWEGDLAKELRDKIAYSLRANGVVVILDEDKMALKETLNFFKRFIKPEDIALDIHFDSAAISARGTSVFLRDTMDEFSTELANDLVFPVSDAMSTLNRGIKTEHDSQHTRLGFLHQNCKNLLIEICFLSNEYDYNKYVQNRDLIANRIADILIEYSNK